MLGCQVVEGIAAAVGDCDDVAERQPSRVEPGQAEVDGLAAAPTPGAVSGHDQRASRSETLAALVERHNVALHP
jgi:hypothetical protein